MSSQRARAARTGTSADRGARSTAAPRGGKTRGIPRRTGTKVIKAAGVRLVGPHRTALRRLVLAMAAGTESFSRHQRRVEGLRTERNLPYPTREGPAVFACKTFGLRTGERGWSRRDVVCQRNSRRSGAVWRAVWNLYTGKKRIGHSWACGRFSSLERRDNIEELGNVTVLGVISRGTARPSTRYWLLSEESGSNHPDCMAYMRSTNVQHPMHSI